VILVNGVDVGVGSGVDVGSGVGVDVGEGVNVGGVVDVGIGEVGVWDAADVEARIGAGVEV
jgi:hypothetical protein